MLLTSEYNLRSRVVAVNVGSNNKPTKTTSISDPSFDNTSLDNIQTDNINEDLLYFNGIVDGAIVELLKVDLLLNN